VDKLDKGFAEELEGKRSWVEVGKTLWVAVGKPGVLDMCKVGKVLRFYKQLDVLFHLESLGP